MKHKKGDWFVGDMIATEILGNAKPNKTSRPPKKAPDSKYRVRQWRTDGEGKIVLIGEAEVFAQNLDHEKPVTKSQAHKALKKGYEKRKKVYDVRRARREETVSKQTEYNLKVVASLHKGQGHAN